MMATIALKHLTQIRVSSIVPFGRVTLSDLLARASVTGTIEQHLEGATRWLVRAHDATTDGGVSYGYSLRGGWKASYPETSGYIAETLFQLAEHFGDPGLALRATQICDWLLEVQNPDGSFSNPALVGRQGIVFDTGQDLFGLLEGYRRTGNEKFLRAACQAGNWLVAVADSRDRWTRQTYRGIPHVYNSRTAWALLKLNAVVAKSDYERVARANLDFALENQMPSHLFQHCAFEADTAPFTHTIAYAIRGLLESSVLLNDPQYLDAAKRAAKAVAGYLEPCGFLPGQIAPTGEAQRSYTCLTGNCQMAIIWGKLAAMEVAYEEQRQLAVRAIRYVMTCQDLKTSDQNVRGGIKGSHPIWGRYSPFCYPNWATKFFIDALLLLRGLIDE
jgi:hypothetical protein